MAKKKKHFLCQYNVTMCDTELSFFHITEGESEEKVTEECEVDHDDCGLDTESSPVGGCIGEKCTELCAVTEITSTQKNFLNSVGIN